MSIEEVQLQLISKLLKMGIRNSEFLPVAKKVIEVLKAGKILASSNADRKPVSSVGLAKRHATNLAAGKYAGSEVYGLSESIKVLKAREREVREAYIGTATGLVSVWYDASSEIVLGIVVELNSNLRRPGQGTTGGISNVVWDIGDDRGEF